MANEFLVIAIAAAVGVGAIWLLGRRSMRVIHDVSGENLVSAWNVASMGGAAFWIGMPLMGVVVPLLPTAAKGFVAYPGAILAAVGAVVMVIVGVRCVFRAADILHNRPVPGLSRFPDGWTAVGLVLIPLVGILVLPWLILRYGRHVRGLSKTSQTASDPIHPSS